MDKFKRDTIMDMGYKKHIDLYNHYNEPTADFIGKVYDNDLNVREIVEYPNMQKAYEHFSLNYNLDKHNFILTNGCEEALRIASQVLLLKAAQEDILIEHIYYENPTWGLAPIILNNSNIFIFTANDNIKFNPTLPQPINFQFKDNKFSYENTNKENSLIYTTNKMNNLFEHEPFQYNEDSNYHIIDDTYVAHEMLNTYHENMHKNIIHIGSYSKILGCGIRLGYIIFHKDWFDIFNQYRPNYISPLAVRYSKEQLQPYYTTKRMKLNKEESTKMHKKYPNINTVSLTYAYETIKADNVNKDDEYFKKRINKEFTVSGQTFYRLGAPNYIEF